MLEPLMERVGELYEFHTLPPYSKVPPKNPHEKRYTDKRFAAPNAKTVHYLKQRGDHGCPNRSPA